MESGRTGGLCGECRWEEDHDEQKRPQEEQEETNHSNDWRTRLTHRA